MFGLNEGLNQSTGIEFPIRMLLGILELVWLWFVVRVSSKRIAG